MQKYFKNIVFFKRKFLVASIFFVLAAWLVFFLAVPPFENADEAGNYTYIQALANGNYPLLPQAETWQKSFSESGWELNTAYRAFQTRFHHDRIFNSAPRAVDESKSDYVATSIQAFHPPLYYSLASIFYLAGRTAGMSSVGIYFFTKLTSLIFYLVFLFNFWIFMRTVVERREAAYLTLAVGIQPTLLMTATEINPEIAAIAFFTIVFSLLVITARNQSFDLPTVTLLGFLSAAAILSKFSNVILIPIVAASLMVYLNCGWKRKIRLLMAYLAPVAILLTPWLWFNQAHYGTMLPHNLALFSTGPHLPGFFSSQNNAFYVLMMTALDMKESFLSVFGAYDDAPVFLELRLLYAFIVLLFIGIGIWHFLRDRRSHPCLQPEPFVSSMALMFLLMFLVAYSIFMKVKYEWMLPLQGHYYLAGLLPATILFYSGLKQTVRVRTSEETAKNLFYLSFLILLVGVLFCLLPRFYV